MRVKDQPDGAQVVVLGGGVIGCSVAYHLAKLGLTDVVLLEQGELSSGTTWHAAGIIGQVRANESMTELARYGIELYSQLEQETGFSTGWRQCGALWVARREERVTHLRRAMAAARGFGTIAELISPAEAKERFPLMETRDLRAAVWLPEDGTANPADLTQALARGAVGRGATILEHCRAVDFEVVDGRIRSVTTDAGRIECEVLVIAAGQWSKAIGDRIGITIPLYPAQHFYAVTEPIEGIVPDTPILRDPDGHVYFKAEVGGLVAGSFEPNALPWVRSADIPHPFSFQLLDENWDHFGPIMESAVARVPALSEAGVRKLYNGPESFTPDNNFLLGAAPEVDGVFVAAGFNSGGIANAGGAGLALAEWIMEGEATRDLWSVDITRFGPFAGSDRWLRERTIETLGDHYSIPWPNREPRTGRNLRRSPLHTHHEAAGASFGTRMGWERVNWYAGAGGNPEVQYSFGSQNWHALVAEEHQAARERVAVFDLTSFAKFVVRGSGAEGAMQYLCANDMAVPVGTVVYTALLNDRGRFESDVTVTRTEAEEYLVVSGTGQQVRDLAYLRRQLQCRSDVAIVDVTSSLGVLGVMGPASRELLSRCSDADMSRSGFKLATSRIIHVGQAPVRATRMSFVGELGWELYLPVEATVPTYELLMAEGADLDVTPAGYYAIDSLRIEAGNRAWGRELTLSTTPLEAGLDRFVKLDSAVDFRGRKALEKQRREGLTQRLINFAVENPQVVLWGGEPVFDGDRRVGSVTSAAHGHTVGTAVGIALVQEPNDGDAWQDADLWLDLAGVRTPLSLR